MAEQEREGLQKREALNVRLSELEARERQAQEQVSAFSSALEDLRQQRDAANAALTESKVGLASEEQQVASFRQQLIRWPCALTNWRNSSRRAAASVRALFPAGNRPSPRFRIPRSTLSACNTSGRRSAPGRRKHSS